MPSAPTVTPAPVLVTCQQVDEVGDADVASLLTELAALSRRNANLIRTLFPAETTDSAQNRWDTMLENGPDWAGGHGELQHDADTSYLGRLTEAARTWLAVVADVDDLRDVTESVAAFLSGLDKVSQLPIDDSYGDISMTLDELAELAAPTLAVWVSLLPEPTRTGSCPCRPDPGRDEPSDACGSCGCVYDIVDVLAGLAAGARPEYFTLAFHCEWDDTALGLLAAPLPSPIRSLVADALVGDDPDTNALRTGLRQ